MSTESRRAAMVALVQVAVLVAIWLWSAIVYSFAFAAERTYLWAAVDMAIIAGGLAFVSKQRDLLGFSSLGARRIHKLVALVAIATAAVVLSHHLVGDANGEWGDETAYLATVRAGAIVRDGVAPFNMRWLQPFLAGPWNVLPVDDVDAMKAINFGGFVVTGVYLALLLVRLGVRFRYAMFAPVLLLCSYLGTYGSWNRLVIDAFNYVSFVLLFHTLMRRKHWKYFPILLLIAAFNSEKVIYWIPVFGVAALFHDEPPWTWQHVRAAATRTVCYAAPTIVYLAAIWLYLKNSKTAADQVFAENTQLMSFTWLGGAPPTHLSKPHIMWFPFGAFSLYTLLSLVYCERWVKAVALLLIPIMAQTLIATDTQRMVAYSFIVYLPLGYLYLARAFDVLPEKLAITWWIALLILAIGQHYGAHVVPAARSIRLVLSLAELFLSSALIFLHLAVFQRSDAPRSTRH
jgi:hypothetical protein